METGTTVDGNAVLHQDRQRDDGLSREDSPVLLEGVTKNVPASHEPNDGTYYADYPFLRGVLDGEKTRKAILECDGQKQINSVKSTDGWLATMICVESRALDKFIFPWAIITANAIIWTTISEFTNPDELESLDTWEFLFGIVLNTSLSFLLVFRLNRAAERFWLAREQWGAIVGVSRHLVSGIAIHGGDNPEARDEAIAWVAGFSIATMQFIRSIPGIPKEMVEGILSAEQVRALEGAAHPPIYAADHCRLCLKELFGWRADTHEALNYTRAVQLELLEKSLNRVMDQSGAMERIKSSPLPTVYVAHLRTFLLFYLFSMPYIWEASWKWLTIPVVCLSSFAMLGIEGASQECEAPFERGRPNHLNMDAFCLLLLTNIQQTIKTVADREIGQRQRQGRQRTQSRENVKK